MTATKTVTLRFCIELEPKAAAAHDGGAVDCSTMDNKRIGAGYGG